jgi:hypothetical protein
MGYGNTVKDGTGSFWENVCDAFGRLIVNDSWETFVVSDTTADDSDKSFAVPANYEYKIVNIFVTLVTTATVGNRQLVVELTDGTNVIAQARAGIVQAASLTRYYNFSKAMPELVAFRDTDYLSTQLPDIQLLPTYVLRVYDKAAIAAAADDMTVRITFLRRQVS